MTDELNIIDIPVQRLRIEEGDILVLRFDDMVSYVEQHERVRVFEEAMRKTGRWCPILCLRKSVDIAVIEADPNAPRRPAREAQVIFEGENE